MLIALPCLYLLHYDVYLYCNTMFLSIALTRLCLLYCTNMFLSIAATMPALGRPPLMSRSQPPKLSLDVTALTPEAAHQNSIKSVPPTKSAPHKVPATAAKAKTPDSTGEISLGHTTRYCRIRHTSPRSVCHYLKTPPIPHPQYHTPKTRPPKPLAPSHI